MDNLIWLLLLPLLIILLLAWRSKTGHGLPPRGGRDPLLGAPRAVDASMKHRKAAMTLPPRSAPRASVRAEREGAPQPAVPVSEGGGPARPSPEDAARAKVAQIQRDMQSLLAQGRFIDAIKLVRQHSGMGLKEAKDWIEANRR